MEPNNQVPNSQAPVGEHKKVGPIVAVLIIVLILIIAALYLFAARINREAVPSDNNTSAGQNQTVQPITNKADDVDSLDADLDAATNGVDSQNF